ncbi:MAG TPA: COP23 domain-containing protein [Coleofasciculaceae cyanobacterium]
MSQPMAHQEHIQLNQGNVYGKSQSKLRVVLALLVSIGSLLPSGAALAQTSAQTSAPSNSGSTVPNDVRFSCEVNNGEYTVMYRPQSQPGQSYPWAKPGELGGGWTPERRCAEISRRLEFYRPDGLLEMQTAVENGYNTVCVTTEKIPSCRIVLTVPPGQDPTSTRDRVFSNLTVADSGQQTGAVNTFTGSNSGGLLNQIGQAIGIDLSGLSGRHHRSSSSGDGINLRPFLDRADGGTGERLR